MAQQRQTPAAVRRTESGTFVAVDGGGASINSPLIRPSSSPNEKGASPVRWWILLLFSLLSLIQAVSWNFCAFPRAFSLISLNGPIICRLPVDYALVAQTLLCTMPWQNSMGGQITTSHGLRTRQTLLCWFRYRSHS